MIRPRSHDSGGILMPLRGIQHGLGISFLASPSTTTFAASRETFILEKSFGTDWSRFEIQCVTGIRTRITACNGSLTRFLTKKAISRTGKFFFRRRTVFKSIANRLERGLYFSMP